MQHLLLGASRRRRQGRRDLLVYLEAVSAMLRAGFDLAYAWPETLQDLGTELSPGFRSEVSPLPGEGFVAVLERLGKGYSHPGHRLWFQVLAELYGSGAPLAPTLEALTQALRQEQEREWQAHLRSLPLKISLLLAVFFLLPALALVFLPLLAEMAENFR